MHVCRSCLVLNILACSRTQRQEKRYESTTYFLSINWPAINFLAYIQMLRVNNKRKDQKNSLAGNWTPVAREQHDKREYSPLYYQRLVMQNLLRLWKYDGNYALSTRILLLSKDEMGDVEGRETRGCLYNSYLLLVLCQAPGNLMQRDVHGAWRAPRAPARARMESAQLGLVVACAKSVSVWGCDECFYLVSCQDPSGVTR